MSNFKNNADSEKQQIKMSQEYMDKLMKEFLEKGGKIEKLKPGYPTQVGSLERGKKPRWTREDMETGKKDKTPRNIYKKEAVAPEVEPVTLSTDYNINDHDHDVGGYNPPEYIKPTKNETPIK
jgi:hypothetical protein|tara:strand:+ start:621 stop:989 length:369 start_codon:yes stop_codon:yes gene_type:complete